MEFLSLSNIQGFLEDLDHDNVVADIKSAHEYLSQILSEEQIQDLIDAVENEDLAELIRVMHTADEEGITVSAKIYMDDVDDGTFENGSGGDLDKLLEIVEIYEALEDNNYTGGDLDGVAFIAKAHFKNYIEETEIESGNIASHLVSYLDWENLADNIARNDYGIVEINAPELLGSNSAEFYYRK